MYQISALYLASGSHQRIACVKSSYADFQWLICPFGVKVSPWLLIHRQGLFDDDFDSLATRLDSSGQINTLNQILYPGFHAQGYKRDGLADALKRRALKAYKLPNNSLWDVRQHTELYFGPAQEGQGVEALTSQLVHEMGTYLVARWQLADGLNHQFYSEPWYRQAAILASEFSAGAIGVIQDFANLLASIGKALWRCTSGAFEVVVNLDIESLKANFNQLAAKAQEAYGWVIESAAKLADMIAEGARMLKHALSLPRLASIVTAYLDGLTESLSTPQRARLIGSAAGEFGLDVLLTIFTLGAATAARHALRAGKAASAMVGPFSTKMLELIAKLSKMQAPGVVQPSGLASFSEAVSPSQLSKASPPKVSTRRSQKNTNTPPSGSGSNSPPANQAPREPAKPKTSTTQKQGTNHNGQQCPTADKTECAGEPVSLVTGEELLQLTDFDIPGALTFTFTRTYRSSKPTCDGLGTGWTHSFADKLVPDGKQLVYHTNEGRLIRFALPTGEGDSDINSAENLRLLCLSTYPATYGLCSTSTPIGPGNPWRIFSSVDKDKPSASTSTHNTYTGKPDPTLRLVAIELSANFGHRFSYSDQGLLNRIHLAGGQVLDVEHSGGRITGIRWANQSDADAPTGYLLKLTYGTDSNSKLIQAEDALGKSEHYTYGRNLLKTRKLATGLTAYFEWDGTGHDARCTRSYFDEVEGTPTYDYRFFWGMDRPSKPIQDDGNHESEPLCKARQQKNLVTYTDTRGASHTWCFNDNGNPVYHRDAEGHETSWQYDAQGHLNEQTLPGSSSPAVRLERDASGAATAITHADGHQSQLSYNSHGQITALTDATGATQRWAYDEQGRLATYTDALGRCQQFNYNALGLLDSHINPANETTRYVYNAQGQLQATVPPHGTNHATRYAYNPLGKVAAVWQADKLVATYEYNSKGLLTAQTDALGQRTQYHYSPLGLLSHTINPAGETTRYKYNGLSQVVAAINPDGTQVRYQYDGERNLIGIVNEAGDTHRLYYDGNERLVGEVGFDGLVNTYHYNGLGHLTDKAVWSSFGPAGLPDAPLRVAQPQHPSLTRQQETLIDWHRYQRNASGQMTQHIAGAHLPEAAQEITNYQYNSNGLLTHARNKHAELQWTYDAVGQLLEHVQNGLTTRYGYDVLGNCISRQLPNGHTLNTQWESTSAGQQWKRMTLGDKLLAQRAFNAQGLEASRQMGNGLVETKAYDALGRLLESSLDKPMNGETAQLGGPLAKRQYAYNARGQISNLNDQLRGLTTYHYDLQDRLAEAVTQPTSDLPIREAFAHHPSHAVLASADSLEKAQVLAKQTEVKHNRLIQSHRGVRYEYDALGRRVCEAPVLTLLNGLMERAGVDQPAIPQRKQYAYNAQGQLASVHIPDTETTVTFTYDPLGRRNSKTVTESKGKPTTTRYLWDGDHLLAKWVEGSPAGATTFTSYIFEPGSFTPLAEVITPLGRDQNVAEFSLEKKTAEFEHELKGAKVEHDSTANAERPAECETRTQTKTKIRFYHTNHLGAPEEITNEQGELIWRGRYSAYGNVLIEEGEETQPFRFAGQFADPETGLYYNRHRYYDAETESFISQDPIGLLGGLNPYRYVQNPVGWVDPLGLTAQKEATTRQVDAVSRVQTQTMPPMAPGTNSRPDFYVGPSGPESTLPGTAYRYMGYKDANGSVNQYAQGAIDTKKARLSYFGFEKLETGDQVTEAFQIRAPKHVTPTDPEPAWSDGRLRLEFDTLQLYENGKPNVSVPYSHGGKGGGLEPFTFAYPEYGSGGAQQLLPSKTITITADKVEILPEK